MNICAAQPEAAMDREMAVLMLDAALAVTRGPGLQTRLRFGPYRIRAIRLDTLVCVQISTVHGGSLVLAEFDAKDLITSH